MVESVPEIPEVKTAAYRKMAPLLREHTLLATNSSTLLPSDFAAATGRPERFCALHFANLIWLMNIAEIMAHPTTADDTLTQVTEFAIEVGMLPIPVRKEQNGCVINTRSTSSSASSIREYSGCRPGRAITATRTRHFGTRIFWRSPIRPGYLNWSPWQDPGDETPHPSRIAQFPQRDGVEVVWKSFQLQSGTRTDPTRNAVQYLAGRKGWTLEFARQAIADISNRAGDVGLTFDYEHTVIANTFDAHRVAHE